MQKKTKFMLIGSAYNLSAKGNEVTNSIIMNNSIIESVLSQKCLGVEKKYVREYVQKDMFGNRCLKKN